jgi:hypothetical protein
MSLGIDPNTLPSDSQTISADQVRVFRKRALDNGYPLIRVKPRSKVPFAPGWQRGEARELLLDVSEDALNTGVLLGDLRCVDFDIDDPQVSLQVMAEARRHLPSGALIRRRAGSPRLSMFYRSETGQPTKRAVQGDKGKIEVLGRGQQAVIDGVHPAGAQIFWRNGLGPDTVPFDQLGTVSEEQITATLNACEPLLGPKGLGLTGASRRPGDVLPSGFGKLSDRFKDLPVDNAMGAGITPHHWFSELPSNDQSTLVQACLDTLDNRTSDPREAWLQVLFAVADAEQHGCPDARDLALDWSRRGRSWTSEHDFDVAWNSFKSGGISVGSLLARARDAGLDLSRWRDLVVGQSQGAGRGVTFEVTGLCELADPLRFICLPSEEAVARINTEFFVLQSSGKIYRHDEGELHALPKQDFKTALGGRWVSTNDPNGNVKRRPAADVWLDAAERCEYRGLQYCPNHIGLKPSHLNLWRGWGDVTPAPGDCSIVIDHIKNIVAAGDKAKADFLLNWLADIFQNPTRKPGVAVVLRGRQGCGKSVVGAIARKLLGPKNVLTVNDRDRMLGRFNSAVMNKILLFGEEMLFAGDRATTDKLKHFITGQTLPVEFKFGDALEIESYHRLLLASNHEQVFQAAGEERRFVIYDVSDDKRGDADYFDKLYALADGRDNATAAALMKFLLDRDLSGFRPWKDQQALASDAALTRQKQLSLSAPLAWLREVIDTVEGQAANGANGDWGVDGLPYPNKWPSQFSRSGALRGFRIWSDKAKPFGASEYTGSPARFWAEICKVIPHAQTTRQIAGGVRVVSIDLADVQNNFEKYLRGEVV